jgi:hypothetical protein
MTRVELRDAIVQRTVPKEKQAEARGLFGVARSMLASVVETGLHLPDAAKVIRGDNSYGVPVANQSPVATVTLAEIYAAQGHRNRALVVLEDVLREEPDHAEALRVRAELMGNSPSNPPESEIPKRDSLLLRKSEAPVSASEVLYEAETTEYVPGGFVETTGEVIESEEPPEVDEAPEPEASEPVAVAPEIAEPEPAEPEPAAPEPEASEIAASESESNSQPVAAPEEANVALVLVQSDREVSLYWELPRPALDQCGVDPTDGEAALRLVTVVPSGVTPERSERAVSLSSGQEVLSSDGVERGAGWIRFSDLPPGAAIRAAVGWNLGDAFLPLAVARSVEECGADQLSTDLVRRVREALG